MNVWDQNRANKLRNFLPNYAKENIQEEEKIWKEKIFRNLEKYISEDKPDQISYWLECIDVYITYETFCFTKEEIERLAMILHNFIISTNHIQLIVTAANIFNTIISPHKFKLDIKLQWRPLYNLLYASMISHSKIKNSKYPPTFVDTLIVLIRYSRSYWDESATEEMLEEWKPFLDPHYHTFTLYICLLVLFLPVNHGKHNLWVDTFRNLWTLYRTQEYDILFVEIFMRLAREGYKDLPWDDILPFEFNVICVHMGVPAPLIYTSNPMANGFHPELYSQFFKESSMLNDILWMFSDTISYLIAGSTQETTRNLLVKLFHVIEPFCSSNRVSNDTQCIAPVVFIDTLIDSYTLRYSSEKNGEKIKKCDPLTEDDNYWLAEHLLPLVYMVLFHEEPMISHLGEFVQLAPSLTIPSILSTVSYSFEYAHLKNTAMSTMVSIAPTVFYTKESFNDFMALVSKVPDEISFMDTTKSFTAFSLIGLVATSVQLDSQYEPFVIKIIEKCIEFAANVSIESFSGSLAGALTRIFCSVTPRIGNHIAKMIADKIDDMPDHAIGSLVEAMEKYGPQVFKERVFKAKTYKDFIILKSLARQWNNYFLPYMDKVTEVILEGFRNKEKKITKEAVATAKWFLRNMLNTYPLPPSKQGFTTADKGVPEYHIPSDKEVEASLTLSNACLEAAEALISKEEKQDQLLGILICRGVIKGIMAGVSSEDMEHEEEPEGFDRPQLARFHDKKLADIYQRSINLLLSYLTMEKTYPEVICNTIKYLKVACNIRDSIGTQINTITSECRYNEGKGRVAILEHPFEACTYLACYWKAIYVYAMRHSLDHIYFPKITRKVLDSLFELSYSPNMKIRMEVACYYGVATDNYKNHFVDLYRRAISILEMAGNPNPTPEEEQEIAKLGKKDDIIAGLSDLVSALTNCILNEETLWLLLKAAMAVCIQLPPDEILDPARAFRQVVIFIDQFDMGDTELVTVPPFSQKRELIIREAIKRYNMYASNTETQNYAAALVCAVLFGSPLIYDIDVIQFIIDIMKTDDEIVRDCLIQTTPAILESMIPRVPRPKGIKVAEVTPENYDQAQYEDRKMTTQAQKMPHFLTREEYMDEKVIASYFPNDDPKERIKMHDLLFKKLVDDDEPIDTLIKFLVDTQDEKEKTISKFRITFWCSLCRMFGFEFTRNLFAKVDAMITTRSNLQQNAVAAEIFTGIIHSLKSRPYSYVSRVAEFVCPFVTKLFATVELEFFRLWNVSFFICFNEMDPRRLFWLYEHLLTCIQWSDNIKAGRVVSLITDILLNVAYNIPSLSDKIQEMVTVPLFSSSSLKFEQIRDCSIRALKAMVALTFDLNLRGHNPKSLDILNKYATDESNNHFIMHYLASSFATQSLTTLSSGEYMLHNIQKWAPAVVDDDEDEEQIAREAMIALSVQNWIGTLAKLPLTKENSREVILSVINEMKQIKGQWQVQVIAIALIGTFLSTVFMITDDDIILDVVENIAIPSLCHKHPDVQDSAVQLLIFIFQNSVSITEKIPDYVERFSKMLYDSKANIKLAGAKGLTAIINSTTLFVDVPQYVIDCFQYLTEAVEIDKVLEPTISQFIAEFWSTNEGNMLKSTAEMLSQFRASLRPTYIS